MSNSSSGGSSGVVPPPATPTPAAVVPKNTMQLKYLQSVSRQGMPAEELPRIEAYLRQQNRSVQDLPVRADAFVLVRPAPGVAAVAVNQAGGAQVNVLGATTDLPLIDGHTHIQGMSLQKANSDPFERPSWLRRNARHTQKTISVAGKLVPMVNFVEYSATNDEVVAHMGLLQLNEFVKANRKLLTGKADPEADSVMVALSMDFGFTPLMCGYAMMKGGAVTNFRITAPGGRIRSRKEKPKTYFIGDAGKSLDFVADGDTLANTADAILRSHVGAGAWVNGATVVAADASGTGVKSVYVVKHDGTNNVRITIYTAGRVNVSFTQFHAKGIPVVEALRKELVTRAVSFHTKFDGARYLGKGKLAVVDTASNDYKESTPDIKAKAWLQVEDCHYTGDPENLPDVYFYLNQKDLYFQNTIDAIWRVASLQCGRIWPLVPFDPRRANALDFVKDAIEKKGHIGVKMYTRTMWMPTGNAAMYGAEVGKLIDDRAEALFKYLEEKKIPIVNHTSPTGWPAWPVYPEMYTADKGDLVPPNPFADTNGNYKDPKTNDTPYRVRWQEVGSIWRRYGTIGMEADDAAGHPQYAAYENGPELKIIQAQVDSLTNFQARFQAEMLRVIVRNAARIAHYNVYVQLCVSPSAWKPVLAKHPKLRINLAHAGSKLTPYLHYAMNPVKLAEDALVAKEKPEANVMCAPKVKTPAGTGRGGFQELFTEAVAYNAEKEINMYLPEAMADLESMTALTKKVLGYPAWTTWFAKWHERFGDGGWWADLMGLLRDYPNVYSDFSYYTEAEADMVEVLSHVLDVAMKDDAPFHDQIVNKTFLGSDWFMTEADKLSSEKYWQFFQKAMETHFNTKCADKGGKDAWHKHDKYKAFWERWTSTNAIKCYALGEAGMDRMEAAYKGFRKTAKEKKKYTIPEELTTRVGTWVKPLPSWWKKLKAFYKANPPT